MKRIAAVTAISLIAFAAIPAFAGMEEANDAYFKRDFETALTEYRTLAADGDAGAAYWIGHMYEMGEGVPANKSQALSWYRKAADMGSAQAAFEAGRMYEMGTGTPQDFERAFESYKTAAERGNVEAKRHVAMMHAEGRGTQVDYLKAARLLKVMADDGDAEAEELLTALLHTGRVPKGALDHGTWDAEPEGTQISGDAAPDEPVEPTLISAPAAPATDGERIRKMIEQALNYVDMGDEPDAEADLIWSMDMTEDTDGTVTIDVTDLAMVGLEGTWDIGNWRTVMTPAGPSQYQTVIEMPEKTSFLDGQGRNIGGTSVGAQSFAGVYNLDIAQFVNLDAKLEQISVDARPEGESAFSVTIDQATVLTDMTEDAPGKWSGPQSGEMYALNAMVEGEGGLKIDRMWFDTNSKAIDYKFFHDLQEQMQRLELASQDAGKGAEDKMLAQAVQDAFAGLRKELSQRQPVAQGYVFSAGAEGAELVDFDGTSLFTADRVDYGFGFDKLDQPASLMTINYSHDGLAVAPGGDIPAAYVPRTMNVAVEFDNMPLQDTVMMALDMAEGAAADPGGFEEQMEMSMMFLVMGLQQQLTTTGAVVRINALDLSSDILDVVTKGELTASDKSPVGLVGKIDVEIAGLDDALAGLKGAEPGSDEEDMAMMLAMVQSMGQRTEADGRSHHTYAFEFAPDGMVLLNGNDIEPLINGMMEE